MEDGEPRGSGFPCADSLFSLELFRHFVSNNNDGKGVDSMILDRLGVLTDEVSANLSEALDWIAAQGLKHVEIRMVDGKNVMDLPLERVDEIRREVEAKGLFVSALASPVFKCALDPNRKVASGDTFGQQEESVEAHFAKLDKAVEIAKRLGTNRIRIFSFWREENPSAYTEEIVEHLRKAAAVAEREGVMLLLENEPSCNGGFAAEVGEFVRRVDSPALKALWDPGNEAYGARNAYPDGYEAVKDVLAHVHLKDAKEDGEGKRTCVPIGQGLVDYVSQIRALERDGYKGLFTIETHYIPPGGTAMDGTAATLAGLRKLLEEMAG